MAFLEPKKSGIDASLWRDIIESTIDPSPHELKKLNLPIFPTCQNIDHVVTISAEVLEAQQREIESDEEYLIFEPDSEELKIFGDDLDDEDKEPVFFPTSLQHKKFRTIKSLSEVVELVDRCKMKNPDLSIRVERKVNDTRVVEFGKIERFEDCTTQNVRASKLVLECTHYLDDDNIIVNWYCGKEPVVWDVFLLENDSSLVSFDLILDFHKRLRIAGDRKWKISDAELPRDESLLWKVVRDDDKTISQIIDEDLVELEDFLPSKLTRKETQEKGEMKKNEMNENETTTKVLNRMKMLAKLAKSLE